MFAVFLVVLLGVANSTSCGNEDVLKPQLSITVADVKNAGTDQADELWVRILLGRGPRTAEWSTWQHLDTAGCDDLDRGQTDYFDLDLDDSDDAWLAIAFYNDNTDGILIDSFQYWDGNSPQTVDRVCGLVSGPGKADDCMEGEAVYDGQCQNSITNDPSFDMFWVDAGPCSAASINLDDRKWPIGTEFFVGDPGTPANPTSRDAADVPSKKNLNVHGTILSASRYAPAVTANYLVYVAMAAVAVSVISFMCGYYYFKRKYGDGMYKPLPNEVV